MIHNALLNVMDLMAEKKLHVPQPFQVFGIAEIENVFRRLQSGQNSGKMVIEMRKHDIVLVRSLKSLPLLPIQKGKLSDNIQTVLQTRPDYLFDPRASYLIAGGLGGLGQSAARWMAKRGAKFLVLLSRSGIRTETSVALVENLQSMGVHVLAPACDVTDRTSLLAVVTKLTKTFPPIKGVIQASMVLKVSP